MQARGGWPRSGRHAIEAARTFFLGRADARERLTRGAGDRSGFGGGKALRATSLIPMATEQRGERGDGGKAFKVHDRGLP